MVKVRRSLTAISVMLAVCLPLAYFQQGGGLLLVGLVIVVFTVVQTIEGYLLTPKIMGDRTGLHPMAIIVAVFFWGSALGGILGRGAQPGSCGSSRWPHRGPRLSPRPARPAAR